MDKVFEVDDGKLKVIKTEAEEISYTVDELKLQIAAATNDLNDVLAMKEEAIVAHDVTISERQAVLDEAQALLDKAVELGLE